MASAIIYLKAIPLIRSFHPAIKLSVVKSVKPETDVPADENDSNVRERRIDLHGRAQWLIIERIANGDEQLLDIAEQLRRKYDEFFQ